MKFNLRALVGVLIVAGLPLPAWSVSVSGFSPTYGSPTDPHYISIYGSGFLGGALEVRFNGTRATSAAVTDASGTIIQARVPTGATSGPISVKVGSAIAQSADIFTVIGAGPFIHSFTPGSGGDGTQVTLRGAHFTGVTNVNFNGKAVSSFFVTSDTQFEVNAPQGVSSGPIQVRSPSGTWTTSSNFFVPPALSGFSPQLGRAGTNVFIIGTNLLGTTAVNFQSAAGSLSLPGENLTVLSNSAVRVTVPLGAVTGRLRLVAPAGSADTSTNFVVPPLITGFTPGFGAVNTPVLIIGANLNDGNPTIRFNGVVAAVSGVSFSQLTALVPAGASSGPISIQNTNGTYTSSTWFYLPPVITSISPSNSPPGSRVTLKGENFLDANLVSFNGVTAVFDVTNNSTIGVTVPNEITTGPITLSAPGGVTISTALYYAAPSISGFSPTHGLPGTVVVISGVNFLGASAVAFNGRPATTFSVLNNNAIQATVPADATEGPITVTAPAGTAASPGAFLLDYTADLSVTVTNTPNPVFVSSNLLISVVVRNPGPHTANGIYLTNFYPASTTLTSTFLSQGTLVDGGNPAIANLGSLEPGTLALVNLTVVPQTKGMAQNVAVVTGNVLDTQPANNISTTSIEVLPLPILSIRSLVGNRARLSWPKELSDFELNYNHVVNDSNGWTQLKASQIISGEEIMVTDTNPGPYRIYRLEK